MKKYGILLSFIAALLLLTLVICACGEKNENTAAGTTTAGTTAASTNTEAIQTTPGVTSAGLTTLVATTAAPVTTASQAADQPSDKEYEVLKGEVTKNGKTYRTKKNDTYVLLDKLTEDTQFRVEIKPSGETKFGVVFGYKNENGTESYYTFYAEGSTVYLRSYDGSTRKTLSSCYGAGVSANAAYVMRIVFSQGKAYCYARERLFAITDLDCEGTRVGIFSEKTGTLFMKPELDSTVKAPDSVDTLLFGHSYFDGWGAWATHMSNTLQKFNLGSAKNIGIGGSQAVHWEKLKECVAAYKPKLGIYMIGINDMSAGKTPEKTVEDIEKTLLYVKEELPDFKVVLINVNHCPSKTALRANISKTNELMKAFADKHDWVLLADIENAFNSGGTSPDPAWFTADGLHLVAKSYTDVIVPAIERALREAS